MSFRKWNIFFLIFVVAVTANHPAQAQDKETAVKEKIQKRQYVFMVQSVSPARGSSRQLPPEYDLRVSGDSIVSYLPYFGRAFTAPITSEGGIKFTSTSFDYTITQRRKDGWDITIKPKDVADVRQLFLTVFANGTASLQVLSNSREPISFNGYISKGNK